MRSSTGKQLERAELYAFDEKGERIPAPGRGMYEMPVKETRPSPNETHGLEDREELDLQRAMVTRAIDGLSELDRAVRRLQEEGQWKLREQRMTAEEAAHLDPASPHVVSIGELKNGCRIVVRRYWWPLTHLEMAERLQVTPRQIHSSVTRIYSAIRRAGG